MLLIASKNAKVVYDLVRLRSVESWIFNLFTHGDQKPRPKKPGWIWDVSVRNFDAETKEEIWLHEPTMTTALVTGNHGVFYWNGKKEESYWGLFRIKSDRRGWKYVCDLPDPRLNMSPGDFVRLKESKLTKAWMAGSEEIKDRRWRRVISVHRFAVSGKPFIQIEGIRSSYLMKDFEVIRKP